MAERPKPPAGCETWLDWCVAPPIDGLGEKPREYARAELEELRAEVKLSGDAERRAFIAGGSVKGG
jgi:hypothetical protein